MHILLWLKGVGTLLNSVIRTHWGFVSGVILAALVLSILLVRRRRRTPEPRALSTLIKQEKKRIYPYSIKQDIYDRVRELYYPSGALVLITLLLLACWFVVCMWQPSASEDQRQFIVRLQQLDVGVSLVFVPLTIFAIGLSARRTASGISAAEVLLAQTYLFPIAFSILGLLTSFIWITRPWEAVLCIFLTITGACFSLYRLCVSLLDEERLHSAAMRLLQSKVRRSIGSAIDVRIGRELLLNELERHPIQYGPFYSKSSVLDYIVVSSSAEGVIDDIFFDKLFAFADELEEIANHEGYSFEESTTRLHVREYLSILPPQPSTLKQDRNRYITALLGDSVFAESSSLVKFSRSLVQDHAKRSRLIRLARNAFHIRQGESYSRRIRRYFETVKDEALIAIRDQRTGYLEDLLGVYVAASEIFLQEMAKLGGYSIEAANRERQNIGGTWEELQWISRDLREIHRRGCLKGDLYVAKQVALIPVKIAFAAIRYGDHLVFDEFTRFALYQYSYLEEVADPKIRDFLSGRTFTYLAELANYGVAVELKRGPHQAKAVESIGSLATIILLRYQWLLRYLFRKENIDQFRSCKRQVDRLFFGVAMERGEDRAEELAWELEEDKLIMGNARERAQALDAVRIKISQQKEEMLFAVGSAIFEQIAQGTVDRYRPYLESIDQHLDTTALIRLYKRMCSPATQDTWSADPDDFSDGMGAFPVPFDSYTQYFTYLLAKSVQHLDTQAIRQLALPNESDFVHEIEPNGRIDQTLTDFEGNRDKWVLLVPDEELAKFPDIRALFTAHLAVLKTREEDEVIQAPIDTEYLGEFRQRFIQSFLKSASLRMAFQHFNVYEPAGPCVPPATPTPRWGFSMLDLRQQYAAGRRTTSVRFPEEYGKDLGSSESQSVFQRLIEGLPFEDLHRAGVNPVDELNARIKESSPNDVAIIAGGFNSFWERGGSNHDFIPEWQLRKSAFAANPGFSGMLRLDSGEVPVFRVWTTQNTSDGCAIFWSSGIKWRQKSPVDDQAECEFVRDQFLLNIVDLSADGAARARILQENPVWLQNEIDRERYLRQKVWLQVFERFEIDIPNPSCGFKFKLGL